MEKFTLAVKALSDETRLRILNLIMRRECCVCEVMQALDISQTRASRNLKILYDAGFLAMREDGLFTLYSLKPENSGHFHTDLLQAVRKNLKSSHMAQSDLKQLSQARRVGTKCLRQTKKGA